jgi:hypothetical protein
MGDGDVDHCRRAGQFRLLIAHGYQGPFNEKLQ